MKGSLDFKPCTTLDQREGCAVWCTILRTCTMGPIVECGCCSAWLKETMCEFTVIALHCFLLACIATCGCELRS